MTIKLASSLMATMIVCANNFADEPKNEKSESEILAVGQAHNALVLTLTVTDKSGKAIEGAIVRALGTGGGRVPTDKEGRATLGYPTAGAMLKVEISANGYKTAVFDFLAADKARVELERNTP